MRYVSIHGSQKQQEDAQAEVNRILGTTAGSKEYKEDSFAQDPRSYMAGISPFNNLFNSSVDLDTVQKMYNEQAFMYFMQPGMPQPGMPPPGPPQPGMPPQGMPQPGMPPPGMQPGMPPPPGMYGMGSQPGGGNGQRMGGEAYPGQAAGHVASQAESSVGGNVRDEKADDDDSSPPPGFE